MLIGQITSPISPHCIIWDKTLKHSYYQAQNGKQKCFCTERKNITLGVFVTESMINMTPGMICCYFPKQYYQHKISVNSICLYTKKDKFLHFLDAIFIYSFQVLRSINENGRDEMTESIKYVPVKHNV